MLDGDTLVADAQGCPGFRPRTARGGEPGGGAEGDPRATAVFSTAPSAAASSAGGGEEDPLEVFAGAVEGRDVVASPWTPPSWAADDAGAVHPEIVWAVLDCPTYFAAYAGEEGQVAFLARLTARIDAPSRPARNTR